MATDNFAQQVNDFLVTQNYHPEMLNAQGRPDENIENTKIFNFDYVSRNGTNYGTMVVVLGEENEMIVMYGDNLGRAMEDPEDRGDFFKFQEMLTMLAKRNHWNFTLQDISKLKHVQSGIAAIKEGLFEGYYGTKRVSYMGEQTQAHLVINHNRQLGENDARYRYVESIFIETAEGERFKMPHNNLAGAKAMLEHVKQGGKPYDIRGSHINEMVSELKVLNRFNRANQGRVMEGVTKELVEGAQKYYQTLRESLKRLGSSRGYSNYFESWSPLTVGESEGLVEDIKTLFVEQTLDTRIEAALPLLAKIQQGTAMKEVDIFESWINNITEGTWALPDTPESHAKLMELMSKPLIVGPDATNATEQLYDLVGDDVLFDRLSELAQETNGRANIWEDTDVMQRLNELGVDAAGVEQAPSDYQDGETVAPEGTTDQEAMTQAAPLNQAPVAESEEDLEESLNHILRHAGVPVKESRVLDESGETLEHIKNRFRFEVKKFEESGELENDLYDALFDYYMDTGEMPYGVAKARTGDPYNWISDRFAQDCNMNEGWKGTLAGSAAGGVAGDIAGAALGPLAGAKIGGAVGGLPGAIAGAATGAVAGGPIGSAIGGLAGGKIGDKLGGPEKDELDEFIGMAAVGENAACNKTKAGQYCPEHGLEECGTSAGGIAPVMMGEGDQQAFVNKHNEDPINSNSSITGSYYESKESDSLLARIKSLALLK